MESKSPRQLEVFDDSGDDARGSVMERSRKILFLFYTGFKETVFVSWENKFNQD